MYPLKSHRGGERTSLRGTYTPYTFFTSSYTAYTPYMLYQGWPASYFLSYHPPQPTKYTNTHTQTHTHTHTRTHTHTHTHTHIHTHIHTHTHVHTHIIFHQASSSVSCTLLYHLLFSILLPSAAARACIVVPGSWSPCFLCTCLRRANLYWCAIIICVTAFLYWCALIETTIISPSIYITQSYHYRIRT